MHRMRTKGMLAMLALLTLALAAITASAGAGATREYVVVYEAGVAAAEGRQAVEAAGGTVVSENTAISVATVRSDDSDFVASVERQDALEGAAVNEVIGQAPRDQQPRWRDIEEVKGAVGTVEKRNAEGDKAEPLAGLQWDMEMIGATADGSHKTQKAPARCASASSTPASTPRIRTSPATSIAS